MKVGEIWVYKNRYNKELFQDRDLTEAIYGKTIEEIISEYGEVKIEQLLHSNEIDECGVVGELVRYVSLESGDSQLSPRKDFLVMYEKKYENR